MASHNGRVDTPERGHLRTVYAARVRAARAFAGLDQQAVADHFKVSKVTVKRMERGERDTSLDELAEIAALCGVPVGFMLHGFAEDDAQSELVALAAARLLRDEVVAAFQRFDTVSEALVSDTEADQISREALQRLLTPRA